MGFNFNAAVAGPTSTGPDAEEKALVAHPAFQDQTTPVSVYSPGATRQKALISQREAGRHSDAYGGRQAIDWVATSIELYADAAATAPFGLSKDDGTRLYEHKTKGTPPDYEQGPKELYDLLHRPNPFMLFSELVSLLVTDLLLVGNAYWFKWRVSSDGKPLALYRLAPSHVKIVPGTYGPESYEYQPPGAAKPIKLAPEAVIHFRRPNPHSHYYGMGVIQAAGRAMDLELAITDTMAAYYENRADPSLIVQSDRKLSRDTFNKLRAQMRARVAGSSRAGELLVLESGLKASTLSASASDALFDKLAEMSRDRILAKFRVSMMLLGDGTASGGSNKYADARREFDNYTLRPFLRRLEAQITEALTAAWGIEFTIDYRSTLPPEEQMKVAESIAKMPVTVRELRRQLRDFGIDESTGNKDLDELVLNDPTQNMDENGQVTNPDGSVQTSGRNGSPAASARLSSDPGRPPKLGNTKPLGRAGKKALTFEEAAALVEIQAGFEKAEKALNTAGESVSVGNRLPGEKRPSDPFATARTVDIDRSMDSMAMQLRGLARELETDLIAETLEGKALKTSDIVKRLRASDAWKTFKPKLQAILEDGARAAAQSGALHSNRVPDEDPDIDAIVQTIVHRPEGLRGILNTVKDRVVSRVKDVRAENGERTDYESAIRGALGDWSATNVLKIADSEATEAYNEGMLTMLELAGETEVAVFEEDDAPDAPCQEARDAVWPIDHARANRKEHPGCRRSFHSLAEPQVA